GPVGRALLQAGGGDGADTRRSAGKAFGRAQFGMFSAMRRYSVGQWSRSRRLRAEERARALSLSDTRSLTRTCSASRSRRLPYGEARWSRSLLEPSSGRSRTSRPAPGSTGIGRRSLREVDRRLRPSSRRLGSSVMSHAVGWIERGSVFWFGLAAVLINAFWVVALA